jgi:hypothetical protein
LRFAAIKQFSNQQLIQVNFFNIIGYQSLLGSRVFQFVLQDALGNLNG